MSETRELNQGKNYILGNDPDELWRLGYQHKVWSEEAFRLWKETGISLGSRVLDLGCGPGFASFDLVGIVGPEGHVHGIDKSPSYVAYANHRTSNENWSNISFEEDDFSTMKLDSNAFNYAYCRWALCWQTDPSEVVQKVADSLKTGGKFAAQEYAYWGSFTVHPEKPEVRAVIEACREGWRIMDGHIDMGPRLVQIFEDAGLKVTHTRALPKMGYSGDLVWNWPGTFLKIYSEKLIEMGLLSREQREAFLSVWDELERDPNAFVITPLMMEIVGVKQ